MYLLRFRIISSMSRNSKVFDSNYIKVQVSQVIRTFSCPPVCLSFLFLDHCNLLLCLHSSYMMGYIQCKYFIYIHIYYSIYNNLYCFCAHSPTVLFYLIPARQIPSSMMMIVNWSVFKNIEY